MIHGNELVTMTIKIFVMVVNYIENVHFRCDIDFTSEELENLWGSLNVPPDGILSYSAFVQHFVVARHEPPPIRNKLPMG